MACDVGVNECLILVLPSVLISFSLALFHTHSLSHFQKINSGIDWTQCSEVIGQGNCVIYIQEWTCQLPSKRMKWGSHQKLYSPKFPHINIAKNLLFPPTRILPPVTSSVLNCFNYRAWFIMMMRQLIIFCMKTYQLDVNRKLKETKKLGNIFSFTGGLSQVRASGKWWFSLLLKNSPFWSRIRTHVQRD